MITGSMTPNGALSSTKALFISKVKGRRMRGFGLFNHEHWAGDEHYFKCIDLRRHVFTVQRARAFLSISYLQEAVGTGQPDLFSDCSLLPSSDLVSLFIRPSSAKKSS